MGAIYSVNGGISSFAMYTSTCTVTLMLLTLLPILMMVAWVTCKTHSVSGLALWLIIKVYESKSSFKRSKIATYR